MSEPRTKDRALKTLLSLRGEAVKEIQDIDTASLVTEDLVRTVFNESWRFQFEDDVLPFQRAVRDLVTEAIEQALDKGSK